MFFCMFPNILALEVQTPANFFASVVLAHFINFSVSTFPDAHIYVYIRLSVTKTRCEVDI